MRKSDLMSMCLQNLMRRKARTFLTVLGVIIGCCAIIIMISIGVGMKESQEKMLSQMGDLTIITVTPAGKSKNSAKLNDEAIRSFKQMAGVTLVTPKLTPEDVHAQIVAGRDRRFVADYPMIAGLDTAAIEPLGYRLLDGAYPRQEAGAALSGQFLAYSFTDTKRPEGFNTVDRYSAYNMDGTMGELPDPFFDMSKTPMELVLKAGEGNNEKTVSIKLSIVGQMKEDNGKGYETSEGLVMNIKELSRAMDSLRKAAGLKKADSAYQTVLVKVKDISSVASAESAIKQMGYNTMSMESIRKPMEKEAQQKQMMLGGLGAISLIVAALGITNTMIMSISERTREIGIMKALGCYVKDVRAIFLMEAGCIGLIGGVLGIVISEIISIAMNLLQGGAQITGFQEALQKLRDVGSRISVIPPWLLVFALIFSVFIGVGSGYYPANKAVRISALEAIKHE